MTDVEHDPDTERYAYSPKALARLVLSSELRELADRAAAGVPTGGDDHAEPGEEVERALALVRQAQEVLTRAVLFERARHTSWEAIAEQMGMKRQSAHERYREAEQEWKDALHQPFNPIPPDTRFPFNYLRLHEAAYEPIKAGQDLDEWAMERGKGEHAVTGGLPTLSLLDEMSQLLDGLSHLYRDMHKRPDPAARLRLTERKAALLDRIAVEEGRPEAAVQAEEARALAARLRAEIDGAV
uniref:Uncharacterized protein n=1 Tax=Streptomyces sp. 14R-10 TaxID=1442159 RepID=W0FTH2_9ACTN|nr:hypothetical protein [Streptomyces sp. 14R-10]AHF46178.1 hypothetical protein pZL1.13 [Streptomyces sp. 14R-10]